MRESIHAFRCDFLCLQDTHGPGRGQQHRERARIIDACAQLIDGLGHVTRSATVPVSRSRTQSFQQRSFVFQARVVLKPLVSLAADRHKQTKYYN